ncbi:hypothetical protein TNCV_763481 [Trichonephila clavipes]|nr:hypothetical protein TNCV_763481 [Trichonephila clavipes]
MGDRSGDRTVQGNNRILFYRVKSKHDVQYVVLHYLVDRGHSIVFDNRAQQPEMYRSAFKLPSIRTGDRRVVYPMVTQTSIPGSGAAFQYRMQAGK